jgi:hypothetical protein
MHLRADHTFEAHLPGESFEGEYTEDGNVIIMRAHFEGRCTLERHVLRCGNNDAFERAKNRPGEATP